MGCACVARSVFGNLVVSIEWVGRASPKNFYSNVGHCEGKLEVRFKIKSVQDGYQNTG